MDQLGYQGTYQRCVEDVGFLCRFPSSLLWNVEPNAAVIFLTLTLIFSLNVAFGATPTGCK